MSERAWVVHGPHGWTEDDGAVVVYADTRGQAKALGAHEMGMDFTDSRCRRAAAADGFGDHFSVPDEVMREIGFCGEDAWRCESCGLADYSDGRYPEWAICPDCDQCGECGCDCRGLR